ncbi:MAG: CPBP family intramembrane metalloprotease [Bradymonadaceae bacterium]|nr:CPBP family intramembrane metalloprotease [Lujinxingiaceae bacterium]
MIKKKSPAGAMPPALTGLRGYFDQSRDLFTSLVLVLPLFVLYQLGVMMTGGIRNGVDFMTDALWWASGASLTNYLLANVLILLVFGVLLFVLRKKGSFHPRIWPWVVAESTLYAFFFGGVVIGLMQALGLDVLLSSGAGGVGELSGLNAWVLSIGAGLYEELVFRLFMMGGLFWLGVRLLGWPRLAAALAALLISSLAFSAVHHLGSLGEPFVLGTFMFRFVAGILLAAIFYLRGFAVAVYTHAIYDVIVLVFR